ncbi:MAG: type II secretion system F family protein [Armatimonadetes bacterium]|nr:type II secretion system F family protein [Armatimonadota bacterium]
MIKNFTPFLFKKIQKTINLEMLSIFTTQLSTLFKAGISMRKILDVLTKQTENLEFKSIINEINKDILLRGIQLSQALARFPKAFSPVYIAMIRAGEKSGTLIQVLEKMAENYEKEVKLSKQTKAALVYPFIIIILAVIAVIFILKFIVPAFLPILLQTQIPLPFATKVLINLTKMLNNYLAISMIFIILITIYFLLNEYFKTPSGKLKWSIFLLKIPLIGNTIKKIELIKFCRIFALLYLSGVPLFQTLNIIKEVLGNEFLKQEIEEVIKRIKEGASLTLAFKQSKVFPLTFVHMIGIGEKAGNLARTLPKIASFYDMEIEYNLSSLVSLIEPVLIVILGLIVGFILASVFLPLYNIIDKLKM